MKKNFGFSLLELMIVVGLSSAVALYMSKMITDMQKNMRIIETKSDEFEFKYLNQMNFTNSFACNRTIGAHCSDNKHRTKEACDNDPQTNWVAPFITLNENTQSSLNIYDDATYSPIPLNFNSLRNGKIFNSYGSTMFQTCSLIETLINVTPIDPSVLANIDNPFARLIIAILNAAVANCQKAKIGRNMPYSDLPWQIIQSQKGCSDNHVL